MMQQSLDATHGTTEAQIALHAVGEPSVSELLKKAGLSQHLQAFQGISMENFKTLLMQASCRCSRPAPGRHEPAAVEQAACRLAGLAAVPAILTALHILPNYDST